MAEQSSAIVPVGGGAASGGTSGAGGGSGTAATEEIETSGVDRGGGREYRKGNWTLQETMILIQAKKMDDERRLKGGDKEKGKSAEFRWKWVENYCWKNGCQRSQNQCNDKWDNLLRDYKKVREYESKQQQQKSYWQLEKHERKERGLPSNMIVQVYDALHEVVDKRPRPILQQQQGAAAASSAAAQLQLPQQPSQFQHIPQPQPQPQHIQQPQQQQQQMFPSSQQIHLAGPSSSVPLQPPPPPPQSATEMSKSTESEGSGEIPRSPSTKRRRVSKEHHHHHHQQQQQQYQGLAPTVSKSAYELSQTLLACEEKKDKRHRDLLSVEERKLVLEEAKTEISRQGMEGLIGAVNNLANAILTLASDRQPAPS